MPNYMGQNFDFPSPWQSTSEDFRKISKNGRVVLPAWVYFFATSSGYFEGMVSNLERPGTWGRISVSQVHTKRSTIYFLKIPKNWRVLWTVWVFHFSNFGGDLERTASNLECPGTCRYFQMKIVLIHSSLKKITSHNIDNVEKTTLRLKSYWKASARFALELLH